MKGNASTYQSLLRYFPGRPWNTEVGVFRTVNLTGQILGPEFDDICQDIRGLMAPQIAARNSREMRARQSRDRKAAAQSGSPTKAAQPSVDAEQAARAFLESLQSTAPTPIPGTPTALASGSFDLELRQVTSQSSIEATVYPLTFVCPFQSCKRLYILDPTGDQLSCKIGHEESQLRQLGAVYSCARCANMEPILPHGRQMRSLEPGPLRCSGGAGDIQLHLRGSFSTAEWRCTARCGCLGADNRERLTRYCYCHIDDPTLTNGEADSIMAPRAATSGEVASPVLASYIKDGQGGNLRLASIRKANSGMWHSSSVPALRNSLARAGIAEILQVPSVKSILINYGYKSDVKPNPPVPEAERYAKFYQLNSKVPRYHAYYCEIVGQGLAVTFEQPRLAKLHSGTLTYAQAVENELATIKSEPFGTLVSRTETTNFPITRILHGLEHALKSALIREIGLEYFDSRIIATDATIVLFETRDLGDGGVRQLVGQPDAMASWLDRARQTIASCPQDCRSGCIACLAADNASCHGFLQNEYQRWMPPNTLLARESAAKWINGR